MKQDPYKKPCSNVDVKPSHAKYRRYSEVPYYRRQWFFWLSYFTITPVAIGILLFGDVYYVKKGEVVSFGIANRIVAGMLAVYILIKIFGNFTQ